MYFLDFPDYFDFVDYIDLFIFYSDFFCCCECMTPTISAIKLKRCHTYSRFNSTPHDVTNISRSFKQGYQNQSETQDYVTFFHDLINTISKKIKKIKDHDFFALL